MITVRELAAECGCSADDVLIQLTVLNVLTLGPDSSVRDEDAATLRRILTKPGVAAAESATDIQLRALREKLSSATPGIPSLNAPSAVTPFEIELRRAKAKGQRDRKKPKGKHWYPGNDPLNPLDQAIADRTVPRSERSGRKTPGMIYYNELQTIKRIHKQWAQACFEGNHLMSDDQIIGWFEAFPDHYLDPSEVVAVAREGFTPTDAALRHWYGRDSPSLPTLFERICCRDITVEAAKGQIERRKHAG
ncbi:hypothetical protein MINTM020_11260 [Mycobacterium paraintracellulare]|uniref:hypothetical protein n=1 Tax=Mycobacterium paraintracellulare TaxID=1138383 RepID=UPI001929491E|nr:hypothetical protein [Mycobacterium paraintracellulare]BCP09028.1 hypothetical protein MINTM020_11260 [Mycobacterium paraintracellulare]